MILGNEKKTNLVLFLLFLFSAASLRFYLSWQHQSRVWIDEVWVTLSPAFHLLTGKGILNPGDWQTGIRSWTPPGLLFLLLKVFSFLGIQRGTTVLPLVRILFSVLTFSGLLAYVHLLAKNFKLRQAPWLPALVLFLTPEFMRYAASADLSALALPALLWGMTLFLRERQDFTSDEKTKIWSFLGAFLLCFSAVIRFQFSLVPIWMGAFYLVKRRYREFFLLFAAGSLVLMGDLIVNGVMYGRFIFPAWNYFRLNALEGLAASYGTTPFLFSLEILWRFMTEPTFIVCCVLLPFALRRLPLLTSTCLVLFLAHGASSHKEFRFFYGPAVLLAGLGACALQGWLQDLKSSKNSRIHTPLVISILFAASFSLVALWRGEKKVAWAEFDVPAQLETLAGVQPEVKGLLSYGWGGIHSGGGYTFFRSLPYKFAESIAELKASHLDPSSYNYVIAPQSQTPCATRVAEFQGATLLRCQPHELEALLAP